MKQKFEKYLKYVAAAIFVATLAINIAITMDDPFVLLSNAMADTTSATTNTIDTSNTSNQKLRTVFVGTASGWKLSAALGGSVVASKPTTGQINIDFWKVSSQIKVKKWCDSCDKPESTICKEHLYPCIATEEDKMKELESIF